MGEEDSLSDSLKSYEQAKLEEFEVSFVGTSDEVAKTARTKLAQLLPVATEELAQILRNGDKDDSVRLQAIKTVLEYTLGKPVVKSARDDDIDKIIESLRNPVEKEA